MVWLLILFAFVFPRILFADEPIVKITNFSSNSSPEWVEIYNQSPNIIDLANWSIGDSNTTVLYDLALTGCLSPNTYQTFFHNSGWLNDSGDIIYLYDSQNNLIDTYPYNDGKLELIYKTTNTCTPTSTPIPTATITPSVTPTTPALPTITPTNTPVPTATNTPTSTSTPQPTSTIKPSPSPTKIPTPTEELIPTSNPIPINEPTPTDDPQLNVLAAQDQHLPTPTISSKKISFSNKISTNLISIIFIGLGSILLLVPVLIVKFKKNK